MLGSEIKVCKPPQNDLNVVSVIKMTFLYDAQYLVVLLRPKIEVKLLIQSADNWICMGKWPVPSGAIYFHHVVVLALVSGFFFNDRLLANSSVEYSEMTLSEGARAKEIRD